MTEKATLILLAGGKSTRMGRPKHLLPTSQGTMIEHLYERLSPLFDETLVVGRDLCFTRNGLRTVEDVRQVCSPLVGIYSGLCASRTDLCFVLACDMPFVRSSLVQTILSRSEGVDIVVPVVNGYYEPLCAVYRKSTVPVIKKALDQRDLKVTRIYEHLYIRKVNEQIVRQIDPELSSFINLNTPRELALLERL